MAVEKDGLESDYGMGVCIEAEKERIDTEEIAPEPVRSPMSKPTFIDLFAGAGGLSEGFIRAGFQPVAHVEMDEAACYTLKTRAAYYYLKSKQQFPIYIDYLKKKISRTALYSHLPTETINSVINKPIGAKNNEEIFKDIDRQLKGRKVDLIIGGPPCQAYSLVGRARSATSMRNDPRNYLYIEYAKFLKKYQPRVFVFENVLGLKSANGGHYLKDMEKIFNKNGYKIKLYIVKATNFGVLQNRKRIIIIGKNSKIKSDFPDLDSVQQFPECTVNDLFKDLPMLESGETKKSVTKYQGKGHDFTYKTHIRNGLEILTQHVTRPNIERDKQIYAFAVKKWNTEGKRLDYNELESRLKKHRNRDTFIDRFKVVAGDLNFSHTIVAHIAKDGHYYIHPDINQNRSISVREAARLQSFPDDYFFEGVKEDATRTAAFKQIGNAVPPLLAGEIAKRIKDLL